MNTEQAMTVLGNYLDMDEANRKKMLNLANNALETVRLQLIEYKRANRALVVEREELKGKIDPVITWVEDVAQGLNSIREANDNISTLIPKAIEERDTLRQQLAAMTAERDAAERDKGYLSTAILQELPQELYLKVFDRYHKERGTYNSQKPTKAFEELRNQFGEHFDAIEDPDAWVKAQRRGEE